MTRTENTNITGEDLAGGSLAVFDVCDTLYFSNTTHDFVRFAADNKMSGIRRSIFHIFNARISPLFWLLLVTSRLSGKDIHKSLNIGLLGGMSSQEVEKLASKFYQEFLSDKKISVSHELMYDARKAGHVILLCSSSIEPVVKVVAERIGADAYLCTELEVLDDHISGKISHELQGIKIGNIRERFPDDEVALAVSDNLSDASLLAAAQKAIAISYSDRASQFWKDQNVEVIDLKQ